MVLPQPNKQKKYRKNQSIKGLVRFELQVDAKAKERFEAMINTIADEFPHPWDKRQRIALARRQVFTELTHGVIHQFETLNEEIIALKTEIKALSPHYFKSPDNNASLPQAIEQLKDDPAYLKTILSQLYQDLQKSKTDLREISQRAKQYLELYETLSDENDRLRKKQLSPT